jgi:hypothetical protein
MQIDFFLVADSANNGPEGKLNALGLGVRILNYERLPAVTPLALLLQVSAPTSEAGNVPVEIVLVEPDNTREILLSGTGQISSESVDDRIPTGFGFNLGLVRPYRIEGVHRFEATVGQLTGQYEVLVRVGTNQT